MYVQKCYLTKWVFLMNNAAHIDGISDVLQLKLHRLSLYDVFCCAFKCTVLWFVKSPVNVFGTAEFYWIILSLDFFFFYFVRDWSVWIEFSKTGWKSDCYFLLKPPKYFTIFFFVHLIDNFFIYPCLELLLKSSTYLIMAYDCWVIFFYYFYFLTKFTPYWIKIAFSYFLCIRLWISLLKLIFKLIIVLIIYWKLLQLLREKVKIEPKSPRKIKTRNNNVYNNYYKFPTCQPW